MEKNPLNLILEQIQDELITVLKEKQYFRYLDLAYSFSDTRCIRGEAIIKLTKLNIECMVIINCSIDGNTASVDNIRLLHTHLFKVNTYNNMNTITSKYIIEIDSNGKWKICWEGAK